MRKKIKIISGFLLCTPFSLIFGAFYMLGQNQELVVADLTLEVQAPALAKAQDGEINRVERGFEVQSLGCAIESSQGPISRDEMNKRLAGIRAR